MFAGMTSAETLGMFSIYLLIGVPAIALLVSWAAFRIPIASYAGREPFSHSEVGTASDYAYREPADPEYVDALADRVRGVARPVVVPVLHAPDAAGPDRERVRVPNLNSIYRVTLADLVEGSRYVAPSLPTPAEARTADRYAPAHSPYLPSHSDRVGRHRAIEPARPRELVAA